MESTIQLLIDTILWVVLMHTREVEGISSSDIRNAFWTFDKRRGGDVGSEEAWGEM